MSGLDAAFLAIETTSMPMHVAAVIVLDPPAGNSGRRATLAFHRRVEAMVRERLHLVPAFRRRAVEVPFGLQHPRWVEHAGFDLERHVRKASLPAPGGPRELSSYVARVMERPLDRSHPLWEMHTLEGLESGHFAIVAKLHHAIIDGVAGAQTIATFFDLGPDGRDVEPPAVAWVPEAAPTGTELVADAITSLVRQPQRVGGAVGRTLGAVRVLARHNRRLREEEELNPPPAPFRAPHTSLNGALSPERSFAFAEVSLDDARLVQRVFGGRINDVILATVAGALRRLLHVRGEPLDESLVALVPVSTRGSGITRDTGGDLAPSALAGAGGLGAAPEPSANQVTGMLVSLATSVADPVERLCLIAQGSRLAKDQVKVVGGDVVRSWVQLAFPALATRLARLASNLKAFDHLPPLFNVVVSNIPGPDFPLWCAGSRILAIYPAGPVAEGVGLNVTAMSYCGQIYFGLLGCSKLVPEVDQVAHHLVDSLAELLKAAKHHSGHLY